MVRLVKFWAAKIKREHEGFRFKSFMIELILAHLAIKDAISPIILRRCSISSPMSPRPTCGSSSSSATITKLPQAPLSDPVQIIDPVNAKNNVSHLYTDADADAIVDAALEAGDAIDAALAAPTKQETVAYWQKVFGSSFQV